MKNFLCVNGNSYYFFPPFSRAFLPPPTPSVVNVEFKLDQNDPLLAATHVVRGFHEEFPLTELEVELLFTLVCTRLSVSVTNSGISSSYSLLLLFLFLFFSLALPPYPHLSPHSLSKFARVYKGSRKSTKGDKDWGPRG
jgi:hypothetical protein